MSERGELLEQFDMESFLAMEGLDFKRSHGSRGEQLNVETCPACGDERWKVYLNADTGFGNCFVCDETFNKWTFVKAYLNTEDKAVIAKFIGDTNDKFGYRAKKRRPEPSQPEGKAPVPVMPSSLPLPTKDGANAQYLEDRGVNATYAAYFGLRLSRTGYHEFTSSDGSRVKQSFANRILIPVYDLDGELVTFQGRDITGRHEKKYLFPSGLPGTARFLLNGQRALKSKAKHIVVGEGFFDVFGIKRAVDQSPDLRGIVAVGTFGKNLSLGEGASQINAIRRLKNEGALERVTFMWDGEVDALKSALIAGEAVKQVGVSVSIALLPAGKDPAEVEPEVVAQAIRDAKNLDATLIARFKLRNPYKMT